MLQRKFLLGTSMIVGLMAAAAAPTFAAAQTAAPADGTEVDELIVTGSRIKRSEYNSASPVQVITAESSSLAGMINPTEVLQSASVAAGSTQINNQFTGFVVNGGGGVNTVSIRGLGDQRTLVMLNGRRLPPAGTQGAVAAVDLNILPDAIVERYEILKDGASSVYGSDAVAGVVNVITRTNLDGGRLEASGRFGGGGDGGNEYTFSGAYGKVLDRGRFLISGQYYEQKALKYGDRKDLNCQEQYTFDPVTGQRNDWIDVDTGTYKCFGASGALFNYIPVTVGATGAFYGSRARISTDGPAYAANQPFWAAAAADPAMPGYRFAPLNDRDSVNSLDAASDFISPVKRYTLYAEGQYDLNFGELYGEFLGHQRKSSQTNVQQLFPYIWENAPCEVNPFNCAGSGIAPNTFVPQSLVLTPYVFKQDVKVFRGLAGLRGKFGQGLGFLTGWDWDAYVSYSKNRGEYSLTGINSDLFLASIGGDWADTATYTPYCTGFGYTLSNCHAVNLFSDQVLRTGNLTPEDYAYLKLTEKGVTDYTQLIVEGQISGDILTLPAGKLAGAFGVSYRRDELDDKPGANLANQNFYNLATANRTKGDDAVTEAYGELEAPLLKGLPAVEALTLNLSGRYSDYKSYGSNSTYKAGLNWQLSNQYRLRTSYGTSFRAPALFERFLGDQGGYLSQASVDPCIRWAGDGTSVINPVVAQNCAAQGIPGNYTGANPSVFITTGGGENLKPEKSKAFSAGFVWTPEFADLSVAVDYYEIEVNDQVTSNGAAVVGQCYAAADFPTNPFCSLFTRDLTVGSSTRYGITEIDGSFRNIVSQTSRGIDLTTRYSQDVGPGNFTLETQFSYTLEDTQELFPGNTDDFNGLIGEPKVVGNTQARYRWNDVTLTWSTEFVGHQSNYDYQFGTDISAPSNYTTPQGARYRGKNHAEAMWYHHLSLRYRTDTWEGLVGVSNVFNEAPPKVSPALADRGNYTYGRVGSYAFATQYDYIGRQAFVSLTRRF
ncbi:TonB-dependent receptor plug domain-containing protein [Caulobacter endophyticus]|uniref:TonB-dependent receptor n=1 Tax=Caulobacter endophyticus TaxID=2172652 RepID=A0A2T9KD40_9CAUL|nr:TonB-dependent receptor [Caulobacter endophyticus]PVM93889.1 TonB-dependent receptor [Caulobacter endophyticus]